MPHEVAVGVVVEIAFFGTSVWAGDDAALLGLDLPFFFGEVIVPGAD